MSSKEFIIHKFIGSLAVAAVLSGAIGAGPVASAQESGEDLSDQSVELIEEMSRDLVADVDVYADADTALEVNVGETSIEVPIDADDGIGIDFGPNEASIVITPLDSSLGDFEVLEDSPVAAAVGEGYATALLPLGDGDVRLLMVLEDESAPRQFSYEIDLAEGVTLVALEDGSISMVSSEGEALGGLAAPWGIDDNGELVDVGYEVSGNTLTRTVAVTPETAYPVMTNFCIFGKNPNGSCRGSRAGRIVVDKLRRCAGGAAVTALGVGTGTAAANIVAVQTTGKIAVRVAGGPWGYFALGVGGCVVGAVTG